MADEKRDAFNKSSAIPERDIATSAEVRSLKDLREEPEPALTLAPEASARFRVDYELHRWRERRIAYLETRLQVADVGLQRQMRRAFDQER